MKKFLAFMICALLWLCPICALSAGEVETAVSPLPWDDTAGYLPDPSCFSENGYYDESIRVEIVNTRRADAEFFAAYINIKHPSQLRTGLAKTLGGATKTTSAMAKHYNAVIALNGDNYSNKDRSKSLAIRQGVTLESGVSKLYDILLIDDQGDFHIVQRDNQDMLEFYLSGGLNIQNAFSFGPALVVDGEMQKIPEKYSFAPHYKNPRAAIGQLGELSYVFVVVDGRVEDSDGVTLETLAQYMADIGCRQAFNLDGGGSATMVLGGDIYNEKSPGNERQISDIIYFATYVDPIAWGGEQPEG